MSERRSPISTSREVISQDVVNPCSMRASEEARAKPCYDNGDPMSWVPGVVNPVANKMNSDSGPTVAYQTPLPARPIPG